MRSFFLERYNGGLGGEMAEPGSVEMIFTDIFDLCCWLGTEKKSRGDTDKRCDVQWWWWWGDGGVLMSFKFPQRENVRTVSNAKI